ncbi:ankyrin repeat domain-containing protein [Serratia nevei]|uniref:ankyrin repeat domain-containing protein n=1 Tax=Serratia nevei TaxID=2703794 RepID=UPI00313B945A
MRKSIFDIKTEDEYLSYKDEIDINEVDELGSSALFFADYGTNYGKSEWLIKNGIDIHIVNKSKQNALFFCEYEKAKLLIEHGIKVNQVDVHCETALFRPVSKSDLDTCQLLINSKIDIQQINFEGQNVIFNASLKALKLLLKHGINFNQVDVYGNNALINLDSGQYNYLNIAKSLIKAGINLEIFVKDVSKLNMIDSMIVRKMIVECLTKKENQHINKVVNNNEYCCRDIIKRKRL